MGNKILKEFDSLGRKINRDAIKKSSETIRKKYASGELKPAFRGKHHTDETKEKLRLKAISRLNFSANYNKNACSFIDDLNEIFNWNLQHAENGGEVIIGGYFLDGYDNFNNIAFEYDERRHYADIENNILKERDYKRMCFIYTKVNCRFFRYNEETNTLYEVTHFDDIYEIKTIGGNRRHKIKQKTIKPKRKDTSRKKDTEYLKREGMVRSDGVLSKRLVPQSEWNNRFSTIINSGVDISKFGWVGKMELATGLSKRVIESTIKRFDEYFKGKYFRRSFNKNT